MMKDTYFYSIEYTDEFMTESEAKNLIGEFCSSGIVASIFKLSNIVNGNLTDGK